MLEKNNFAFNGRQYLQVGGTAVGTRVSLTYANIFMDRFETEYVYTYHLQPRVWGRYIDDVFWIWDFGEAEYVKFVEHLNKAHPTI